MEKPAQKNSVGDSILKGACNPKSTDLAVQLGEIGLDSLMDEGVLKQIPFLKGIIACKKTWEAIHDQLFLRKVASFILACPDFTEAEREQFAKQHLNDAKSARQLGDSIVLILDRLDDLEKPQMIAKVFAALVRGKIDLATFRRLATAIDIGFLDDLLALTQHAPKHDEVAPQYVPNLLRTGLTQIFGPREQAADIDNQKPAPLRRAFYGVTPLGEQFMHCMSES